jgi:hypothetical protein
MQSMRSRSAAAGRNHFRSAVIVVLVLIGYAWVGIVVDQMPCFLGRPNCD